MILSHRNEHYGAVFVGELYVLCRSEFRDPSFPRVFIPRYKPHSLFSAFRGTSMATRSLFDGRA